MRFGQPHIHSLILLTILACTNKNSPDDELALAARHLGEGRLGEAAAVASEILKSHDSDAARIILAQTHIARENFRDAFEQLQRVRRAGLLADAKHLLAHVEIQRNHLDSAESKIREANLLQYRPSASLQLATLLSQQGRGWEARRLLIQRIKEGDFPIEHLFWINHANRLNGPEARRTLEQAMAAEPNGVAGLLGLSMLAKKNGKTQRAIELLTQCVERHRDHAAVQGELGLLFATNEDSSGFFRWHQNLSDTAHHPQIWIAKGQVAERTGQPLAAIGCYIEALRLDGENQTACQRAGRLLMQQGQNDAATLFLNRAAKLSKVNQQIRDLDGDRTNLNLCLDVAASCEELGRLWEAFGWYGYAAAIDTTGIAANAQQRVGSSLTENAPQTIIAKNPAFREFGIDFPAPQFREDRQPSGKGPHDATPASISFDDTTETLALEFAFLNGHDPTEPAMKMHEFTGGGVGVIDLDADCWPDLYLPQGGGLPATTPTDGSEAPTDRLFRNKLGLRFEDVTEASGISDTVFSQGVTVGDVNNDGFADCYVANIGGNRLLLNNGDGTFCDVTNRSRCGGDRWTTSCAIADLNNDGLNDVYAVNYLEGEDVYAKICRDEENVPRSCRPTLFAASRDQVFINEGDGTFADASSRQGLTSAGRGLGVLAFRASNESKPSLFIANDGEANFMYTPEPQGRNSFTEEGVLKGLAFDRNGSAQACMGTAASDLNNDGIPDIFVTNFYQESNTLYVSTPAGYEDRTAEYGLRASSMDVLGFGTQFLDADLDGDEDLVIVNGHEGNYEDLGIPYRMQPQLFENKDNASFQIVSFESHPYFSKSHLGRGLATLDFNRDMLLDFAVSDLDHPYRLLKNTTVTQAMGFSLRLVGTASARFSVGARVTILLEKGKLQRELIGGSGYLSSNEAVLIFGVHEERVKAIEIAWPSGTVDRYDPPDGLPGAQHVAAEGCCLLICP